jgi:hypothetical protein
VSSAILVLVGAGFLAAAAAAILAAMVVGIRRGDRGHFVKKPDSRCDAFARRVLVGIRYPSENDEGDDR